LFNYLTGKLGAATADGFVLEEPNIQVFLRQQSKQVNEPKELDAPAQVQATVSAPPKVASSSGAATRAKIPQVKTQAGETTTALPKPEEKPDPLAQPFTPNSETKPKKIGKFNVQVR